MGALAPDGDTLVYFSPPGAIGGIAPLAEVGRLRPAQVVPGGSVVAQGQFLTYTFPAAGIQTGTYWLWAALVRQGSLGDNTLNEGDVVAFDSRPVTYGVAVGSAASDR